MARTIFKIEFSNFKTAEHTCKTILISNNFKRTLVKSEQIWKKGGTFMGGQCIKIDYSENHIILSAWITPFFGGEEEYSIEGLSAIIPKKQLLNVIEQIKLAILEEI